MPKIVGIHGIAQQQGGPYALRDIWFSALRDGLDAAERPDLATSLLPDDLSVSFYGRLFRPPGAQAGDDLPPAFSRDLNSATGLGMLQELYEEACRQEPSLGPPQGALGPGSSALKKLGSYPPVQVMIERVLRSKTFGGRIPERAFLGNLKQVSLFLNDRQTKEYVLGRVHQEVGEDTTIIVGHSLGSVVAYEYLCKYRPGSVKQLVTLGSPLGIRNVVFDRLEPEPANGQGAWPGPGSMAWANVADPKDIVALRKDLAPLFPALEGGGVDDRLVDNGNEPHGIVPYLNAESTGRAISTGL